MNFISNLHFDFFKDNFTSNEQIDDNCYCAFAYAKSIIDPISSDEGLYEDIYEQYLEILNDGLPEDMKKYLKSLL